MPAKYNKIIDKIPIKRENQQSTESGTETKNELDEEEANELNKCNYLLTLTPAVTEKGHNSKTTNDSMFEPLSQVC